MPADKICYGGYSKKRGQKENQKNGNIYSFFFLYNKQAPLYHAEAVKIS